MKVIFDCEYDAHGLIIAQYHLDTTDPLCIQTLTDIQSGKTDPVAAGFGESSKLPGVVAGTTRWKAIVNEAAKPTAPAALKALNLRDIVMPAPVIQLG